MHRARYRRKVRCNMVLESVLANVMQQILQARNLHYAGAAESIERIIGKRAVPYISAHCPSSVIRGEAGKAHRPRLYAAHHGSEGVFLAHGAGNDFLEIHADLLKEVLRQIAAMKADSLIGVVTVVVVPVEQCTGSFRGQG